ncbi:MAG TPA: T9SS type A sorting domain-containing protein, partial [Chryseosolibacter sp.]
GDNVLTVDISSGTEGVYFAGIAAEVLTSNESYSWSPAAGLSDAGIQNPLASPAATTTYTVTYTNGDGCTATDQVTVTVDCNTAPVAVCKPVTVEADSNCEAIAEASAFDGGSTSPSGSPLSFAISPAGPYAVGETAITLTVTDANGQTSSCATTLTVIDTTPPSITAPPDIVVLNDAGTCGATVNLQLPESSDNCEIGTVSNDHAGNVFPRGETLVTWTITDIHGNQQTAEQKITVTNSEPVIHSVTASPSTTGPNSPVTLSVDFEDNNAGFASIDWGDLSSPEMVEAPAGIFEATHSYGAAGTYPVTVTITDLCDASVSYVYESIVITTEDQAGAVKGHGWFYSMPGYYLEKRRAAGKAQFEFEAESGESGNAPEGHIGFRFKAGKLTFRSNGLERLTVDGQNAFLIGSAKLNGRRGYGILIGMTDEEYTKKGDDRWPGKKLQTYGDHGKKRDRIRVKIWDAAGVVVYDTQAGSPDDAIAGTELGGGSIQIDSDLSEMSQDGLAFFEDGSASVYPNPFEDWLSVHFTSGSNEKISLQLMDLTGKVIVNEELPVSEDGSYALDLPDSKDAGGLYILRIAQGRRVEFIRVIRK